MNLPSKAFYPFKNKKHQKSISRKLFHLCNLWWNIADSRHKNNKNLAEALTITLKIHNPCLKKAKKSLTWSHVEQVYKVVIRGHSTQYNKFRIIKCSNRTQKTNSFTREWLSKYLRESIKRSFQAIKTIILGLKKINWCHFLNMSWSKIKKK